MKPTVNRIPLKFPLAHCMYDILFAVLEVTTCICSENLNFMCAVTIRHYCLYSHSLYIALSVYTLPHFLPLPPPLSRSMLHGLTLSTLVLVPASSPGQSMLRYLLKVHLNSALLPHPRPHQKPTAVSRCVSVCNCIFLCYLPLDLDRLCWHNFENNRLLNQL